MEKVSGKLTVYFEDPFWVGVFERIEDGKLSVSKVTFGAEPKDYEVQEYIQKCYSSLKFTQTWKNTNTAALFCGGSEMENVKESTNVKQQHESNVNEAENFDTFMKAMVQVVEKYGRFVLQELDCVA